MSQLNCYRCADGKWAWRLTADNGYVVATDGSHGYSNYADAQAMADAVVINCSFRGAQRTKAQA